MLDVYYIKYNFFGIFPTSQNPQIVISQLWAAWDFLHDYAGATIPINIYFAHL